MRTGLRSHALLLASLFAAAFMAAPASGQGVYNIVASPISSDDLDEYDAILQLSDAQRRAIEPAFQEYLATFAAFRDVDVEKYLKDEKDARQTPADAIEFEERRLKRLFSLRAKVDQIDDSFFQAIEPLLSDSQRPQLDRVRLYRQRFRVRPRIAVGIGLSGIAHSYSHRFEPGYALRKINPTQEEWSAIRPLLIAYEQDMTALFRMADRKLTEQPHFTIPDDERQAYREDAARDRARRLLRLKQTINDFGSVLSPRNARAYEGEVLNALFPGIGRDQSRVHRVFDTLPRDELTVKTLDDITTLRVAYAEQHQNLSNRMFRLVEQHWENPDFGYVRRAESFAVDSERIHELLRQREELNDQTLQQLSDIAGWDVIFDIQSQLPDEGTGIRATMWIPRPIVRIESSYFGQSRTLGMSDPFPLVRWGGRTNGAPIDSGLWSTWLRGLGLDETKRAAVMAVVARFEDERQLIDRQSDRLRANQRRLWRRDAEQLFLPDRDELAGYRRSSDEFDSQLRAIEDKLVAAMQTEVLGPEWHERLALLRQIHERSLRSLQYCGASLIFLHPESGAGKDEEIDLVDVALGMPWTQENREIILPHLRIYSAAASQQVRDYWQAADSIWNHTLDQIYATVERTDEGIRVSYGDGSTLDSPLGRALVDSMRARRALAELNRSSLESLAAVLPPDEAGKLRDAYARALYPSLYRDGEAQFERLDRAMKLVTLDDNQRAAVYGLREEYRFDHDQLTKRIVESTQILSESAMILSDEGEWTRKYRTVQQGDPSEAAKMRFQREELNAATLRELRHILTEAQQKELGVFEIDELL